MLNCLSPSESGFSLIYVGINKTKNKNCMHSTEVCTALNVLCILGWYFRLSMGYRNRLGIVLAYRLPGNIAWWAVTTTRFLASIDCSKIPALYSIRARSIGGVTVPAQVCVAYPAVGVVCLVPAEGNACLPHHFSNTVGVACRVLAVACTFQFQQ
jgi:hypothetical protein